MRRCLAVLIIAAASVASAFAQDDQSDAAASAKLIAAAMDRCGGDDSCVSRQMDAFDRLMSLPEGSTEESMLYNNCVQGDPLPLDTDWVKAEQCVNDHMKAPPPPKS